MTFVITSKELYFALDTYERVLRRRKPMNQLLLSNVPHTK
jgi:hypothetical protein